MINKKHLIFPFLISLVLSSCSFNSEPEPEQPEPPEEKPSEPVPEPFEVDKTLTFGMTDICFQEYSWAGVDYHYSHALFEMLGVKSVRFWAHATEVLKDPMTVNENNYKLYREMFDDIKGKFQIIGMSHTNFHKDYDGLVNSNSGSAKPPRDLTAGSKYLKWLDDYETSWYTLVSLFPEIEYWEIDNECNNIDFMHRIGSGVEFTIDQMAEIYYDMSYRASLGIHRANPDAKTVMGGIVTWTSPTGSPQDWLNHLYDLIEIKETWPSNNPDDFFQVACWHPYRSYINAEDYKEENDDIYNVIKYREGKDKKVFLTEAGFNEEWSQYTEQRQADDLEIMYEVVKKLPYVESLHYYRMYDEKMSAKARFGLFTNHREINTKTNYPMAHPKKSAYKYQELAGGHGNLKIYENHLLEA